MLLLRASAAQPWPTHHHVPPAPVAQVGVSNLAVRGTVRLSLKPLLDDFPFAGSVKVRGGMQGWAARGRAGNWPARWPASVAAPAAGGGTPMAAHRC